MEKENYRIAYLTEDVTKEQLLSFVSECVWLEVSMDFEDADRWLIVETDCKRVYDVLLKLNKDHHPNLNVE